MSIDGVQIPKDGAHAFSRWNGPRWFAGWECVMCGKARRPWRKRGLCRKNPNNPNRQHLRHQPGRRGTTDG